MLLAVDVDIKSRLLAAWSVICFPLLKDEPVTSFQVL